MIQAHSDAGGGAADHPARRALRTRIERFACLRAASRALPISAGTLDEAARRDAHADTLRRTLERLVALQDSPDTMSMALAREASSLDEGLDSLESDTFTRMDGLDFSSLRAHLPNAVETHRREGLALLDVLVSDRRGLSTRLGKIEYLVTLLATEVRDGRRMVVHDPVNLTPALARLADEVSSLVAPEVAIELHQAASLDFDSANPVDSLARIRRRKEEFGRGRFAPDVLRAVVTYNARMFNWIESTRDSSRSSDAAIDAILADVWAHGAPSAENESTTPDAQSSGSPESTDEPVLCSSELGAIVDGFRRRLEGRRIGDGAPELIALALDESDLDPFEREAVLADPRSRLQHVVAHVATVGLMLRDRGAIQPDLLDLGITQVELANDWVVELERAISVVLSGLLSGDGGGRYDVATVVSGIKTKRLLAPRSAARRELGPSAISESSDSEASDWAVSPRQRSRLLREAAAQIGDRRSSGKRIPRSMTIGESVASARSLTPRRRHLVALAVGTLLAVSLIVSWMPSGTTATLRARELSSLSNHIVSAYRSEGGEGGLLIGRIDEAFEKLDRADRAEALAKLSERLRREGIRDAMLYDARGALRIHYANGEMRGMPAAPAATASATTGPA